MTAILIHEFGHFLNDKIYKLEENTEYNAWDSGINYFKERKYLIPKDIITTMYDCLLSYLQSGDTN